MLKMVGSLLIVAAVSLQGAAPVPQQAGPLPSTPIRYGTFTARFAADGVFTLEGQGWPTFTGTWTREGAEIVLSTKGGPPVCASPGRYRSERAHRRRRYQCPVREASHSPSTHTSPSAKCSFFQIGTISLSRSIAYRLASNAASRWAEEMAITTLTSPTGRAPVRCT